MMPTSSTTPAARATAPEGRRVERGDARKQRDDFERVLRDKAPPDDAGAGDDAAQDAACVAIRTDPAPAFAAFGAAPALHARAQAIASAPGAGSLVLDGPVDARRAADAPPLQPPAALHDPAAAWQVSLGDPGGAGVELRATRAAGGAESAGWGVTIVASAADAAALTRHAPRLNERLRARAVPLSHVRIEADDEEPNG